jgi:hypothetical protein
MQDPGDTEKYNNFRRFQREAKNAEKELLHAFRDLCNFEFFLKYYRKITDPDEIDHINIRLQSVREWKRVTMFENGTDYFITSFKNYLRGI